MVFTTHEVKNKKAAGTSTITFSVLMVGNDALVIDKSHLSL